MSPYSFISYGNLDTFQYYNLYLFIYLFILYFFLSSLAIYPPLNVGLNILQQLQPKFPLVRCL